MDGDAGLLRDSRFRRIFQETVGVLLVSVAVLAFLGWYLDLETLTRLRNGFATMKPNTALCLALDGVALLLLVRNRNAGRRFERAALLMSLTAALVAVVTVSQDILGADFLIDRVLLPADEVRGRLPGRMSPVTAVSIACLSLSLALGTWRPACTAWLEQSLAGFAGAAALIALLGYLLDVPSLYSVEAYRSIALHTALLLVLLSAVLLLRRPDEGWMAEFTAHLPSAVVSRRMLAITFFVLPAIAWLRLKGEQQGLYDTAFGLALMVVSCLILLSLTAWYVTRFANRIARDLQRLNAELEEKVAARTAELRSTNEQLAAFSYTVAHDLRAPLRVVDGYCDILGEDHAEALGRQGRGIVEAVRGAVRRMGALIEDLLRFAQVGQREVRQERVDMANLAADVCRAIREESGVDVEWEVAELPPALGDTALIRQVWHNLLSNAVKFSRGQSHPHVEIGAERRGRDVIYWVRDHGVGFDGSNAENIFLAFQRLHSDKEFAGSGIGLATVQRIVLRHGGRIRAESRVGQGARFEFTLRAA